MKNNYFLLITVLVAGFFTHAQDVPTPGVSIIQSATIENPGDCTTLTADYFKIKSTTSYQVEAITYQSPFAFLGGTSLNIIEDDIWSPELVLPFKFCFYGQSYQSLIVGSNGVVSFTTTGAYNTPSSYCYWQVNGLIPSPTFYIKNAIYGVYQDTDLRTGPIQNAAIQNVNYYSGGVAPNRYFVANFNRLPNYGCGGLLGTDSTADDGLQTSQIVIYETTNIIDVYVYERTPCLMWSSGAGVIGVQNDAGTQAVVPTDRNTGNWSASQEAWRFFPSGEPTTPLVDIQWYDQDNNTVGTGDSIEVCPTANQFYSVSATYTRCGETSTVVTADEYEVQIESLGVHPANQTAMVVNMYPNPVDNLLHIETNTALASVEIYTLQGQRVLTTSHNQINVSQLTPGLYLIKMQDVNNATTTKKFVKN